MQERPKPIPTNYPRGLEDESSRDYPLNLEFWEDEKWYEATDMWGNEVIVIGESHTICNCYGQEIGKGSIVLDNNGVTTRYHELKRK